MKNKIVLVFVALLLAMSILTSCGGDVNVNKLGLKMTLPEEMELREVSYADICYVTKEVEIFINVFSKEELADPEGLDFYESISVEDFTETLIINNDYDAELQLDGERGAAYFGTNVVSELADEYYFFYVIRNTDALYVIGMECDSVNEEKYKDEFLAWARTAEIDK